MRTPTPPHPEPPISYPSAAIFYAYILTALILTSHLTSRLYRLSTTKQPPPPPSPRQTRLTALFTLLALTSFCLLSWNMLSVLTASYAHFTHIHHDALTAPASLLGVTGRVWEWSVRTPLFYDFARAIFGYSDSPGRGDHGSTGDVGMAARARTAVTVWTKGELYFGWVVGCLVGLYHGGGRRKGKGAWEGGLVWRLAVLGQVLPVSFTFCLFVLLVLLGTESWGRGMNGQNDTRDDRMRVFVHLVFGLFVACLFFAPGLADRGEAWEVLGVIVLVRGLLFTPYFLTGLSKVDVSIMSLVAFLDIGWQIWRQEIGVQEMGKTLFSRPAVSALSCDSIICAVAFIAFWWVKS